MNSMMSNRSNSIKKLGVIVEQLGYKIKFLQNSEELPVDMLNLYLDNDERDRPQIITITAYPLSDELDACNFIQFYFEYPFQIHADKRTEAHLALSTINQEVPLGHFNIFADSGNPYFKYVLALSHNQKVEPFFVNDVLDMIVFAQQHYLGRFEALI